MDGCKKALLLTGIMFITGALVFGCCKEIDKRRIKKIEIK